MRFICVCLFVLFVLPFPAGAGITLEQDRTAAVILAYHRIGEDQHPHTSLDQDTFAAHIAQLRRDEYTVMALPEIVEALERGTPLPPRTVGITFEGGFKSILKNAVPLLEKHNLPFTVFFAAGQADGHNREYLNWQDLKTLQKSRLVTIGLLPATYARLTGQTPAHIKSDINRARTAYRKHLSGHPAFFSYPFGAYGLAVQDIIKAQGFKAAFGLHSGVAYHGADLYALPRFTMTDVYGDLARFTLVTNALPLPVSDIEPVDPYLKSDQPPIGFSLPAALAPAADRLTCFISGHERPHLEILGDTRVEVRLQDHIPDIRTRMNCIMPGPAESDESKIWRWFGTIFTASDP